MLDFFSVSGYNMDRTQHRERSISMEDYGSDFITISDEDGTE